jgi:hypothetical protein
MKKKELERGHDYVSEKENEKGESARLIYVKLVLAKYLPVGFGHSTLIKVSSM